MKRWFKETGIILAMAYGVMVAAVAGYNLALVFTGDVVRYKDVEKLVSMAREECSSK